jgi:hypothetical protein
MKQPPEFWVHCSQCEFAWVAAYLPMEIEKFAKLIKKASCPKCAAGAPHIYCGRGETEDEQGLVGPP